MIIASDIFTPDITSVIIFSLLYGIPAVYQLVNTAIKGKD